MRRTRHTSGAPWEATVGYARAVRVGPFVHVAGTTATDEYGEPVAPDDAARQAAAIFETIETALGAVGARLDDVVRTRIYVTGIADWEAVGRVHGEVFRTIRPAATLVEVGELVHPDLVVEIEAEAIVAEAIEDTPVAGSE